MPDRRSERFDQATRQANPPGDGAISAQRSASSASQASRTAPDQRLTAISRLTSVRPRSTTNARSRESRSTSSGLPYDGVALTPCSDRGRQRSNDPVADDRRRRVSDSCALLIVDARYGLALERASIASPADRARALAEARRLVRAAVALRGRIEAADPNSIAMVRDRREPGGALRDLADCDRESPGACMRAGEMGLGPLTASAARGPVGPSPVGGHGLRRAAPLNPAGA